MAASRSTRRSPSQRGKSQGARRTQPASSQPATLTGAHASGFAVGMVAGLVVGGAAALWLTQQSQPSQPLPEVDTADMPAETLRPRFDFFTLLPAEQPSLPDTGGFQPRRDDAGPSEYSQYILQAGSFRRPEDADRRKGELAFLGLESTVERSEGDNGVWHRVYVGPFSGRSEMMRARSLAAQADIDTLLMKRSGAR